MYIDGSYFYHLGFDKIAPTKKKVFLPCFVDT